MMTTSLVTAMNLIDHGLRLLAFADFEGVFDLSFMHLNILNIFPIGILSCLASVYIVF